MKETKYLEELHDELFLLNGSGKERSIKNIVDNREYIKLFRRSLPLLITCTGSALKILLFIMGRLRDRDYVISIPIDEVASRLKMSRRTVINARQELIKKDILQKSSSGRGLYHFNTKVFFRGNRAELAAQYDIVCKK